LVNPNAIYADDESPAAAEHTTRGLRRYRTGQESGRVLTRTLRNGHVRL
jgi:hypothetical protein